MTFYRKTRRFVRRVAKKAGGAIKRRYYNKKTGLNVKQIVKDVNTLKKMVNAEKKHFGPLITADTRLLGQVNGNVGGSTIFGAVPQDAMVQGNGRSQRSGNSVKAHAFNYDFQITAQANQKNISYITLELYRVPNQVFGYATTTEINTLLSQLYVPNKWLGDGITHIDGTCSRNPDYFRDFRLVRKKVIRVAPDTQSNTWIKTFRIGYKPRNLHQRYNDSNTFLDGQLIWVARCSNGNSNISTTSTLTGVAEAGVGTGFSIMCAIDMYYYDN